MTLKIGVIGTGAMGREHIRRIKNTLTGARVVLVFDVNAQRAREAIEGIPQAECADSADEVISSDRVDAVILTSQDSTHEEYCLKAIAAGKPVFVEKPLASTAEGAGRIVRKEMESGRKLVQVGFMRRYDKGYVALKKLLASGELGAPLIAHCAHRNPSYSPEYDNGTIITGTVIHEIDVMSWLMGDYFVGAQVLTPKSTSHAAGHLKDPEVVLLTTSTGMLVEVEAFVNCRYGYDVQCEIVAENGIAKLPEPLSLTRRQEAKLYRNLALDWKDRFADAYNVELQAWINASARGGHSGGPSAWDGYCAAVTADACLRAQKSGRTEPIALTGRPDFYKETDPS